MRNEIRDMTDSERVVHTANLQEISEFEVFRRGHLKWFGRAPIEEQMESDFVRYLYFGETPPYVRHYARTVLGARADALPPIRRHGALSGLLLWLTESKLVRFLTQ